MGGVWRMCLGRVYFGPEVDQDTNSQKQQQQFRPINWKNGLFVPIHAETDTRLCCGTIIDPLYLCAYIYCALLLFAAAAACPSAVPVSTAKGVQWWLWMNIWMKWGNELHPVTEGRQCWRGGGVEEKDIFGAAPLAVFVCVGKWKSVRRSLNCRNSVPGGQSWGRSST